MYIWQAIDLLEGLLTVTDENKEVGVHHVQKLIVFAVMWSLGALLEPDDRKKVNNVSASVGIRNVFTQTRSIAVLPS